MKYIFLFLFIFSVYTKADLNEVSDPNAARFTVHMLDYLAQDYSGAVENGKVTNQSEYQEQIEFAEQVIVTISKIKTDQNKKQITSEAVKLLKLIQAKAPFFEVQKVSRNLQATIIQMTAIEQTPASWPSIKRGQKLYANNCIACHGEKGAGDGPIAATIEPRPLNFYYEFRMKSITPFQAFNSIRLGIPGTAMQASPALTDNDIWDLAFYVISLRHQEKTKAASLDVTNDVLKLISTTSDEDLISKNYTQESISSFRTYEPKEDNSLQSLDFAIASLDDSFTDYKNNSFENAKKKALMAYLEGVEPVEPRLKATDPRFTIKLEEAMALVRSHIEKKSSLTELQTAVSNAKEELKAAKKLIGKKSDSFWLTFSLAAGILFREGFEAVLLLIALLGVIKAAKSKRAEFWLHIGWLSAVIVGILCWFFSGWVAMMSGAGREMMEGITSLIAVFVLLYIGFWLHSKTEIKRWKAFIDGKVQKALDGGSRIGIALISFMAVFREAFETVLFLRALSTEDNRSQQIALFSGVSFSFLLIFLVAWAFIKYSSRVPIRKLFTISSILMIVLAFILTGKAIHALQETGMISASTSPISLRFDLIGFYPTSETLIAQLIIAFISITLWQIGKKSSH